MEYQYFWVAILITHIQIPLDPGGGGGGETKANTIFNETLKVETYMYIYLNWAK